MNKLIILQGIPGSGKSTFAKSWVEENPESRIIVNRDSIRRMLGPYWIPSREKLVTKIERSMIKLGLDKEYDVIVDSTNLNPKTLDNLINIGLKYNAIIEFKRIDISLEQAIKNDKNREFPVGEKVVTDFYNKYVKDYE